MKKTSRQNSAWQRKPRPRATDDICTIHNRRLKDFEVLNGGCFLCAQDAKQLALGNKTIVHILPPLNNQQ